MLQENFSTAPVSPAWPLTLESSSPILPGCNLDSCGPQRKSLGRASPPPRLSTGSPCCRLLLQSPPELTYDQRPHECPEEDSVSSLIPCLWLGNPSAAEGFGSDSLKLPSALTDIGWDLSKSEGTHQQLASGVSKSMASEESMREWKRKKSTVLKTPVEASRSSPWPWSKRPNVLAQHSWLLGTPSSSLSVFPLHLPATAGSTEFLWLPSRGIGQPAL